jgi:hypothetical protein
MSPDQLPDLSLTHMLLADPVLLIGSLLPLVILAGVIYYRLRVHRRLSAIAARNEEQFDRTRQQSAAQWPEAAARTERMIALLTEIRDHLARIVPRDAPNARPESPNSSK